MFITRTAIAFGHQFHPQITKNMDLETVSHFGTGNHRTIAKMYKKSVPETSKMVLKSIQMDTWTSRCLLGVPVEPWVTKMVTQDTKMEPQGLQNDILAIKSFNFRQSTSQQFPSAKGAGSRGEALKFAPTL